MTEQEARRRHPSSQHDDSADAARGTGEGRTFAERRAELDYDWSPPSPTTEEAS